jgi:HSP20 family protein
VSPFTVVLSRALLVHAAVPDGDAALGSPCLDVVERDDRLVVIVDLPGSHPDEIRVTCQGATLVVDGAKAESVRSGAALAAVERFHTVERAAGPFRRIVRLPWVVDPDRGEARYRDGVLTVTFPRVGPAPGTGVGQ